MKLLINIALCLIFSSYFGKGWSQAGNIKVTGKVINTRNQAVPVASISIEGGQRFAADADGFFSVNLAAGKYVFTFTATGYQPKIVDEITIAQGADNNIDVVLEYAAQELDGVVVRSSRRQESTNALLSFQKNNTSLSSGLAADFIRRTPDKNTGEVLRRVSGASIRDNKFVIVRGLGDRYNSAYINGAQLASTEPDKKSFSFDVIPSQLIDNIVINKTATPDLTGEFAGGLVQVTTKDIPTSNTLSFGASFGFNTQSFGKDFVSNPRGSTDWLGFDDGQRKLTGAYPLRYSAYNQLSRPQQTEV
ncbi:MAG: carboxypeptidase regulatory-like domain-containing protein, partial [Chitinophagaceae bacterium]|nr:carboxypeptidase regulatory-like domain-containing protein [Chitinophagaceae bacterium]